MKFVFERDAYRLLVNVSKLNGNKRPENGRTYHKKTAAIINGIKFLVHKTGAAAIVGASPPPNQVARKSEVADHTPNIGTEEPERNRKNRELYRHPENHRCKFCCISFRTIKILIVPLFAFVFLFCSNSKLNRIWRTFEDRHFFVY